GYVFNTTDGNTMHLCQPLLLGQKLYFFGGVYAQGGANVFLHRINTDGSAEAREISVPLGMGGASTVRIAASPDGKWMYMVTSGYQRPCLAVMRAPLTGLEPAKVFVGASKGKSGSDNEHFQDAAGLDCDATGRIYVCDRGNNRIQIYSAEAKHLKTLPVDRPELVRVHPKTGALYVVHKGRVQGKSLSRLTKFTSFEAPVEEWHADNVGGQALALDSWSAKPRLWLGSGSSLLIYEEDGKKLNKLADFNEEAKKEEGANYIGQWGGTGEDGSGKVVCDPVREQVYFANARVFDLKSGALLRTVRLPGHSDDIAFDKRGYMHCHFNPSSQPAVGRLETKPDGSFSECPYDYGEESDDRKWIGIIKTKDQLGAKYFQDGVGVNMMGDVAEQCNIYWAPKFEAEGEVLAMMGAKARSGAGEWVEEANATNERYVREMAKKGITVYSIRRRPGIPLTGATAFTFRRTGELMQELAVNTGGLINGVQIDEDGSTYFVFSGTALRNGRPYLTGKGGTFGTPADKHGVNPFTGTLMKTIPGKKAGLLLPHAAVPLDEKPARPADLEGGAWADGVEWMYAGASPIVGGGCSCPTQRFHLDWYKRSFVAEAYRHSIGVVDTAGNLIMHLGTYGNYDSGFGAKSRIPVGGDNIAMFMPRFISGTDNYLVFSDWGERVVVLKIAYHAEERIAIGKAKL
ncbi:hypothetical protein ACFL01_04070, partial [Planctomycetota bacterium]